MASRDDVYREFGKAAELAQLIETELGTALLAHEALEKKAHINPDPEHFERVLDAINKNTLGQSLRQITRRFQIKEDLESVFAKALETRNHLSHHFYREHGVAIDTTEGRDAMVSHLVEIQSELQHVHQLASYLSEILYKAAKLLRKVHSACR